ncbi:MAG TPA: TraB/GumN family protein [Burkholderiales bacterium]
MKSTLRWFFGLVLLSFLWFPPATAAEPSAGEPKAKEVRHVRNRGLLYEVKNTANLVYLFGTIHLGRPDFYPLGAAATRAFSGSKYLVVEADVSDKAAMQDINEQAMYPPSTSLEEHLPPPLLDRTLSLLREYRIPKEQATRLKPWALILTISAVEATRAGYDPALGTDLYLIERAKGQGKPILELEGLQRQTDILDGLSNEAQQAFLDETLTEIESGDAAKNLSDLAEAWSKGDAAGVAGEWVRLQRSGLASDKMFVDKLLLERNVVMARRVEEYLRSGERHFVAVGALHLVGEKSIVDLLKRKGLKIREIR